MEQQHAQAQESIDALVTELQETLARLEQEQQQVAALSDKLESTAAEHSNMQKQVCVCNPSGGVALCVLDRHVTHAYLGAARQDVPMLNEAHTVSRACHCRFTAAVCRT
jgi:hypothetical protein